MSLPRLRTWALLAWIGAVIGLAARLAAYRLHPDIHPDELFQYIEPAWWHLHGYGWPAWEWAVGLRSWVLPAYHGAWMVLLSWVGVRRGEAVVHALQLHWALLGLCLLPAAWRAGRAMAAASPQTGRLSPDPPGAAAPLGWEGGLLAVLAVAVLPEIAYFAPHTFSEAPSMILLVWGCTLWLSARARGGDHPWRTGLWTGALLAAGVCIRLANGPLVIVPVVDLWARKRWRALAGVVAAGIAVTLAFGVVDWVTWGEPFHSALAYLDYNFVQGRAAEHATQMRDSLGFGLVVLVVPVILAFRRVWPWAFAALLLFFMLSTQAHKEERFVLVVYPLLAVSWGAACGRGLMRIRRPRVRALAWAALALLGAAVVWRNAEGIARRPALDYTRRWGLYAAQAWAGRQPDATGVLVEGRFHLSGGWVVLGRDLPLDSLDGSLVNNPLYNYAIVRRGSAEEAMCRARGYQSAFVADEYEAMRR
jgi:phosphatidylinositol glycan class B